MLPSTGRMTEPRNYAPRTAGLPMSSEPPPKFNLDVGSHSSNEATDLSTPNDLDHQMGILVQQAIPETQALAAYQPAAKVPDGRSEKLKALTNPGWGAPHLASVLDPSSMPFAETAKQATAKNHGVVRLGNVCLLLFTCLHY